MSNAVNRASIPSNFIREVADTMKLPQPQPQMFFARMAMGQRIRTNALMSGAANARAYAVEGAGGETLPAELDEMVLSADTYPEAILSVEGFGLNKGDMMSFDRDVFQSGGYTKEARRLQGTKPTSEQGQGIKADEAKLVLDTYRGPWDPSASEVRPYEVHEFDAKFVKNRENLRNKIGRHLTYDFTMWLDHVVRDEFRKTGRVALSDGKASVADYTPDGGSAPDLLSIFGARANLIKRNRRPFPSGRYLLLVPTNFDGLLLEDGAYRQLSAFKDQGRNHIYGYVTSIQNIDIVQVANLATYVGGDTVAAGGVANSDGVRPDAVVPANVVLNEALLIAPGAIGVGVAQDPEPRLADSTNYGEAARFIWDAKLAIGNLDSDAVERFIFQG